MKDQKSRKPASVDNIYKLDGRVPIAKAIPFGLQHVLAMFVANVTPVMLIASVAVYNGAAFTAIDTALLIQAAMLIAGIGTLIQLYPVWRIGSRLRRDDHRLQPAFHGHFILCKLLRLSDRRVAESARRGRVRGRDDPVSGSAQACQDGGRRRTDRGHHRKQKTGITKSKTAGASRRTGCSCFACREVGFL